MKCLHLLAAIMAGVTVTNPPPLVEGPSEDHIFTHHCHEDEYQYITPDGLTCTPIDGGRTYVVATEYEFARP